MVVELYGITVTVCGEADTDGDDVVDITELIGYIAQWKNNKVTIGQLMEAIGQWKNGC